ncbi:MAG: cytoskeleton protein RodZ [Woeseiaceae bacterium]|jgi:cytoskeleton protein RodZ
MIKDSDEIKNKGHLDDEVSCGELLAKTRLIKGLSTKDIAKELRISASIIEMIERDDFEKIGVPVFVKGYLRQYANILDLPVDQLLESYNQLNPEKSSAPIVNAAIEKTSKFVLTPKLILVSVFALIALFLIWFLVSMLTKKEPLLDQVTGIQDIQDFEVMDFKSVMNEVNLIEIEETITEKSELLINQDLEPVMNEVNLIEIEETITEKSELLINQDLEPVMNEVNLIEIEETEIETSEFLYKEPEGLTLTIEYSGLCWTEIYDVNGKLLFYELGDLGKDVVVSGAGPMDVLFGAATEVLSLSVDSQNYPLPGLSRQDEVLRLKVSKL